MPSNVETTCRWNILCDFDGTIIATDFTDHLLDRFADPGWRELEAAWLKGDVCSRVCLMKQTELLKMSRHDLDACLLGLDIDSAFPDFVDFAQRQGCEVRVASEGYVQVIRALLGRAGVTTPLLAATHLIDSGQDRWMLGCPFARSDCRSAAATCKCALAQRRATPRTHTLVIGDGRSDFCVASRADFVFARGALLEFCRNRRLPHAAVDNFVDAQHCLAQLLAAGNDPMIAISFETGELRYG